MAAPVRFGLIGLGRWGKVYLRSLLALGDRCRITHLATSRPEHAALVPYRVQVTADWRALLRAECDAVIIATPAHTHADIVDACLEARRPCIVEKPLCLDVARAERLHQRAQASGVPVLVDHTMLFSPAYQAMRRLREERGEPIRLIVSEGMALGPFRTDISALWDWCPHDVSLCLDLLGQAPVAVAALGGPVDGRGSPELLTVRLDFAGGACAWIQAGRLASSKRRSLSVFTDTRLFRLDGVGPDPLTVSDFPFAQREADPVAASPEVRVVPVPARLPLEQMLIEFVDGLAGGDRPRFGTGLALDVVRVLARCEAALKEEVSSSHGQVS
ncbi:MAG: Gfo/Idh/MocA family oxidoreductase [Candidatus Omnitrophica bacterium]|nr:Gfo/Idh/MocA family oxidoreductase [Candidatus Omnitrophota bacterium]